MNSHLKRYRKEFEYSYALGVTCALELLETRPEHVLGVVLATKGERNAGAAIIRDRCAGKRIPVITDDKTIERLSPRESHLAIGIFHKYRTSLDPDKNHVILVNPSDMGNLGTIARTMVGFNMTNLALIKPAVDIFNPRTIRASIGAIFRLSFEYFESFDNYRKNFTLNLYPLMVEGQVLLDRVQFKFPFALIFGNESSGLPREFLDFGTAVAIQCEGRIDSLNLSSAVAITLYESTRARR